MAAAHKSCIPVLDAPGHGLQQNWWGGHGCPSPPSRRRCAGHLSPPVRRRAAGCLPRHQGLPSVCEATGGKKKKIQRKKVLFLLCLPPFRMHNLTFCCLLGEGAFSFFFPTPLLLCQAHQKFAGSCVRVRMPNNFISCLEGSQRGVHRTGGGCWGAFPLLPLSSCPPFSSAGLLWLASSALPLHFIFIYIS